MNTTVKIIPDQEKNSISFSKNFRIFSTKDPIRGVTEIYEILDDIEHGSPAPDLNILKRRFRYSINKIDWSLWYVFVPSNVTPNALGPITDLVFNPECDLFLEFEYSYDDGTCLDLSSPIQIEEIKIRFKKANHGLPSVLTPIVFCSDEKCPAIIFESNSTFRPYEVDSAIGVFKELSYHTNVTFGHEVVYFRTLPDTTDGDYIFKEWTIYENVDRKCVKVLVPSNKFPSNKPIFSEYGIDFEAPFEIHIDHRYFQSIFGAGAEPRKRDFLYFPLINRMFEIQGSYLHRGFMMEPTYWKIQLYKFSPNIDMLMKDENRQFLDNIITSSDALFAEEIEDAVKDATMPQQYSTISTHADASRSSIHPDIKIKPLKFNFNYASLIENYYDLSKIAPSINSYFLTSDSPLLSTSMELVDVECDKPGNHSSYKAVRAYEGSDIFNTWKNNALMTNDKNVRGVDIKYVRVRGPFDTIPDHIGQSESGRYLQIEAYKDLTFTKQRDILVDTIDGKPAVNLAIRDTSVVYKVKPVLDTETVCDLSYTCLFNVPADSDTVSFIKGFDNETEKGIYIYAQFNKYFGDAPEGDLVLHIKINDNEKIYTIPNFKCGIWHGMVVSVSNQFKQIGTYVYEIIEDVADLTNHVDFKQIFNTVSSMTQQIFNIDQYYTLPTSKLLISNIRLFKTMIKEEQHNFILSQQYIKDESMLLLIDNVRPQINIPYITRNR